MRRLYLILGVAVAVKGASVPVTEDPLYPVMFGMDHTWRYDAQSGEPGDYDPDTWDGDCASGTKQSPIDVVANNLKYPDADPGMVVTHLFDLDIEGMTFNTDRHVTFGSQQKLMPYITGGPLSDAKYVFSHMDFHFGSDNTQGSEHTMDDVAYPMEIQLVFFNGDKFSDIEDAGVSTDVDALATISYMVEVDEDGTDNADLSEIIDSLAYINHVDPDAPRKKREAEDGRSDLLTTDYNLYLDVNVNLGKIFGLNVDDYYYYDGSMTSPSCAENVRWILSTKKLSISQAQLDEFRVLETQSGTDLINDNFRPVQPLGSRTVYWRRQTIEIDPVAAQVLGASIVGAGVFHQVYTLLQQPETAKALRENPLIDFINNIPEVFQGEQEVVQQRSSDVFQQQYVQPVYQPQQYQQYVPQPAQAPVA